MDELIQRIEREVGIAPDVALAAVRIILNFLHTDGPSATVERLAAELGAADMLADAAPSGGFLGRIGGMFGGGGAMAAFSALTAAGLDMEQIQGVVATFVAFSREKVGDETVDEIVASIPGLERLL